MERTYIVECYWPGVTQRAYAEAVTRVRAAAGATREVRFLDSLLVPVDEAAYFRFAGGSAADVEQACRRAGLSYARILEYVGLPEDAEPPAPAG